MYCAIYFGCSVKTITYSVNVNVMSLREPIHFDVTYAETNRRRR